jgi:membrane protease YdiL (CAAX protease family)
MSAIPVPVRVQARPAGNAAALEALLLIGGLAAIVLVRAWASQAGLAPLAVGAAFSAGLLLLAAIGGASRPNARRIGPAVVAGAAVGLALVAVDLIGPVLGGTSFIGGLGRPAAPFVPWAVVVVAVAVGEEAILRGALFDRLLRAGGVPVALLVTALAFALLHVPLYGWHVVPLDLAVGLALGGLRLGTGGFVAPAVAHAVADLATWWL